MELLKKLCETGGIPGQEGKIRQIIKDEIKNIVDDIRIDRLGNIICYKKATVETDEKPLKVMIAGHMDEIGFIVSNIDDNGFLRLQPLGGFDARTLMAQRVKIYGKKQIYGVIGSKPIHILTEEEKKKKLETKDYFVAVGLPKEEVEKIVQIGDMITMDRDLIELGNCVNVKALDDRVGIYVMLKALKKIKNSHFDIYVVGTVQEEVGCRGSVVSAFGIEPDISIALDTTIANDLPGAGGHQKITILGEGVAIKLMDGGMISHPKLLQAMRELAEEKGIKYQIEILPRGGTDGRSMQQTHSGSIAIVLSIATRYVHTCIETAHKEDIQAAIDLLAVFLEEGHKKDFSFEE